MASTVGGMRHIGVTAGLADQVCGEIRKLDEESLNKVLEFVAQIRQNRPTQTPAEKIGSADAIQKHVSKWSFNEGERAKLTAEVYRMREGAE